MKIEVEPRLINLLKEAGCTGYIAAWPSGPSGDLFASVRITVHHEGDTCPLHESNEND